MARQAWNATLLALPWCVFERRTQGDEPFPTRTSGEPCSLPGSCLPPQVLALGAFTSISVGSLLLGGGVVSLLLPLVDAESRGVGGLWPLFGLAVVLLGAFGWWEVRSVRLRHGPLFDPRLTRIPGHAGGSGIGNTPRDARAQPAPHLRRVSTSSVSPDIRHQGRVLTPQAR